MEREFLEEQLAAGRSLEQVGRLVGKHPSTVGYWLKKHGLVAAHHAEYAPRGGIARERLVAQTPLRRFGAIDDVADAALFQVSDAARFVNGVTLVVDGGLAVASARTLDTAALLDDLGESR